MPQLQLISDLPGHSSPAWQVSFNPTRSLLASCSTDKTFRLYSYNLPDTPTPLSTSNYPDADSPKPRFDFQQSVTTEHKKSVRSISWAKSGRTLATGSFDSSVGIWEEVDDEGDVREGIFKPKKVDNSEDEEGEDEEDEEEIGGKEWECVTTLEGHDSECKSVAFSSDGGLLGSCSRDKSVWVWEGMSHDYMHGDKG
jgi:WD40 repeat protein